MKNLVQVKNGPALTLASTPFASGGEGDLFRITAPADYVHLVVKLYKPDKCSREREEKIAYLIGNSPDVNSQQGQQPIIWPCHLVHKNNRFVGFTMPLAKGEKLEWLCHGSLPPQLGQEWKKFDFAVANALELRIKLCFNIAVAIHQLHKLGKYVLVDLKPENIMVQSNGLVSVIDLDSVEVIAQNAVKFIAQVATPEYTPPEYYRGVKPENGMIPETWDRFSMAVIFYRILCGIHPFAGSCRSPYHECSGMADLIKHGLFPNGGKSVHFMVIPQPHKNFEKLETSVQELFRRCFDDGHSTPSLRPAAYEWCSTLLPQSELHVERALPSTIVRYSRRPYSRHVEFNPPTAIVLPEVQFLQLPEVGGMRVLWSRLAGKSTRHKLRDEIAVLEDALKTMLPQKSTLETGMRDIVMSFYQQQKEVLRKEKEYFDQIKGWFVAQLESIDKAAIELHKLEIQELKMVLTKIYMKVGDLENTISSLVRTELKPLTEKYQSLTLPLKRELNKLEEAEKVQCCRVEERLDVALLKLQNQLKELYDRHVSGVEKIYEDKVKAIDWQLDNLKEKEQKEMDELLVSRQKSSDGGLAAYKISSYANSIFTDSYTDPMIIVANLRAKGIETAADFAAVNDVGNIQRSNGKWVKVAQVGAKRAQSLDAWRNLILNKVSGQFVLAPNDKEAVKIRLKFTGERDRLLRGKGEIAIEKNKSLAQIPVLLAPQKMEAERNKAQLEQQANTAKKQIRDDFLVVMQPIIQQLDNMEHDFRQGLLPFFEKMREKKDELNIMQEVCKEEMSVAREKINRKYDGLNEDLYKKARQAEQSLPERFQAILDETGKVQGKLFSHHEMQFTQLKNDSLTFLLHFRETASRLATLQQEYARVA